MESPRSLFALICLHVVAIALCVTLLSGVSEGLENKTTPSSIVTTRAPTTRPPTHGPTTNASITTSQAPTKAPPSPRPNPLQPAVGNWTIHGPNNTVCMRLSFALQWNISYTRKNNKDAVVVINMSPDVANLTSDCKSLTTNRTLTIYPVGLGKTDKNWTVSLKFSQDSEYYSLIDVRSSWVYNGRFPDSKESGHVIEHKGQGNFLQQRVKLGNYYTCTKPLTLKSGEATVRLLDIQLQPFAEKSKGNFGDAEACVFGLSWKYIVIIAVVGGALLLAVIVLIACCVVNKRKKYRALQNE